MKTKAEQYANEFLTEKMSYQLGKIVKTETGEERVDEVKIDPFIV
jgi:DNA-binding protein YbaB